ncbi:MAG: protein translocase subunit SecD [Deltaproteobacteria bacterium]|nr:protein translocase subunit SecD [Deltaproteobacteria bacterium]
MNKRNLWRTVPTILITLLAVLYVLPTLLPQGTLPGWYPFQKKLSFGLDLQGGLELRYTVDYKKAISENMLRLRETLIKSLVDALAQKEGKEPETLTDEQRAELASRFNVERSDFNAMVIKFKNPADVDVVTVELVEGLRSDLVRLPPSGNEVEIHMSDLRVSKIRDEVVDQTLEVIRKRVEAFGLVEPDVRKVGDTDIDIQLPGVSGKQVEEVRKRIGQTARLTFRIVDRSKKAADFFKDNADKLKEFQEKFPEKGRLLKLERDPNTTQWYLRADAGLTRGKGDALAKNALLSFLKNLRIDDDHMVGFQLVERKDGNIVKERFWRTYLLFSEAKVTGDDITRAMVLFERQGEPYVSLEFNARGGRAFADLTEKNVGEYLAIMMDDEVSSAPEIKERIGGGRAKISMGGARNPREVLKDAQSLVTVLTHGAYKAPVHKVHDFEVGPSLGQDTIDAGVISLVVALVLVFAFMIMYYGVGGIIADIGLLLNILFILAILVGFNAALTMPGLAGIVLTIGMAVDANVLITARIREEMRLGKGPRASLEAGYGRAFSAIFDANLTTGIAGIILLNYSSGPVYGFAVTLLIGIAVSFVTQVYITRMIFNWVLEKFRPERLSVGI